MNSLGMYDHPYLSAFSELILYELLVRFRHRVEVHPPSNRGTAKRSDFLVRSETGERFYMEAVLATDETDDTAAARSRLSVWHGIY